MIFKILEALRKAECTLDSSAGSWDISTSSAKPQTLADVLHEEAKGRFKEGTSDLTPEAINEAQENNFDPELYRKLLFKLKNSNFLTNNSFQSQALAEYQRGIIDLDKLIEENSIQRLASLYSTHSSQMDIHRLLHLNSEVALNEDGSTVLKKTTFVHQLLEQKAPRRAIIHFFTELDTLAMYDKDLIHNYLELSNESGQSIRAKIAEESLNTEAYRALNLVLNVERGIRDENLGLDNEDTHTSSIHGSVDASFTKLSLIYDPTLVKQTSSRTVQVNRDTHWQEKIDQDLRNFENELREIISSDQRIDEFLKPTLTKVDSPERAREKFKFQAKTALRLFKGLTIGRYGKDYQILANEPVSCGLTPKEIVAISYAALSSASEWHNEDQKTQHFIELVEHLYIAKRGYNIDHYGSEEWRTHPDLSDDNKCTGGMINEVANGLRDHKLVQIKVITVSTMSPVILKNLENILEQIAKDATGMIRIQSWLDTGIIDKSLSNKIIESLKQNKEFTEEFSNSEISIIGVQALNKFNLKQLNKLKQVLIPKIPQLDTASQSGIFDRSKISNFVYREDKGYILYLEDLYYKNPKLFADAVQNILTTITNTNLDGEDSRKTSILINLLLNSRDKQIVEKTSEVFKAHLKQLSQKNKDRYLLLSCICYSSIAKILISSGANVNATDDNNDNRTPLIYAAINGHTELVAELIAHKAIIETKDKAGKTPLIHAAIMGHEVTVAKLIELGADVNVSDTDYSKKTPLIYAAEHGKTKTIEVLLKKDSSQINNALIHAAIRGHTQTVVRLLELGADIKHEVHGITALISAAKDGHTETVAKLIELGASQKEMGKALVLAAESFQMSTCIKLIELGADINAKERGLTALMLAAMRGKLDMLDKFIELGANKDASGPDNKTAIFYAALNKQYKVVARLLDLDYNEDSKQINSESPAKLAAAISTIIKHSEYTDALARDEYYKLAQRIINNIKPLQVEVLTSVLSNISNETQKQKLLSFVSTPQKRANIEANLALRQAHINLSDPPSADVAALTIKRTRDDESTESIKRHKGQTPSPDHS